MKLFGNNKTEASLPPLSGGNKGTGELGEEVAANFMIARGYRVLERNFRCKGCEVILSPATPVTRAWSLSRLRHDAGFHTVYRNWR